MIRSVLVVMLVLATIGATSRGCRSPQKPELYPVPHIQNGNQSYCIKDATGNLLVTVRNVGTEAGAFDVTVEFNGVPKTERVPSLAGFGASTTLAFPIPPGCPNASGTPSTDCPFRIIVDSHNEIVESREDNNTVSDRCIG